MSSVAVIVGSSQGIGLQLARIYLSQTGMQVVALSRNSKSAKEAILDTSTNVPFISQANRNVDLTSEEAFKHFKAKDSSSIFDKDRLTAIDVDVIDEESIRKASEQVKSAFGKDSVRLIFNVAGKLKVEKSLAQVEYEEMLSQFQMNTFAPLLAMKHFTPLLQSSKTLSSMDDLSHGLLPEHQNIVANMSARVGSINDNHKGGWYSYRASKAAQNQITRTASLEMAMRKVPAICVGLHPGTVRTDLSKGFTGGSGAKQDDREKEETAARRQKGEFEADESASLLTGVISRLTEKDGGLIWDYAGKQVPY
ncbi:hypothetical protein CBS101457_006682 [Exobasidium rhododendri]|nr:hypothetical protein CBS101457_006682 [Exobasidium rhododendri]